MMKLSEWNRDVDEYSPEGVVRLAALMKSRDGKEWFAVYVPGLAGRIGILQCRPSDAALKIVTFENRDILLFPYCATDPMNIKDEHRCWQCDPAVALRLLLPDPLPCFIAEADALNRVISMFPAEAIIVAAELQGTAT